MIEQFQAIHDTDDPVDDEGAALAIALDHEAQAIPAGKVRIERQAFEQVERQFQPVGFFRIDIETDVIPLGQQRQLLHRRQQFAHHPVGLRADIARMERRQLDRDAGIVGDRACRAARGDGGNGVLIGRAEAVGICGCQRGLKGFASQNDI